MTEDSFQTLAEGFRFLSHLERRASILRVERRWLATAALLALTLAASVVLGRPR